MLPLPSECVVDGVVVGESGAVSNVAGLRFGRRMTMSVLELIDVFDRRGGTIMLAPVGEYAP